MKKTIEDVIVEGRRMLVRADFNVPLKDGVIQDETRIKAALPTIRHAMEENAAVVLCSHLGRPGGKVNDAFATAHRAHASTEGVAHHLPSVAGLLMVREMKALQSVRDEPAHPFVAIFGGVKVPGKIHTLDNLLDSLDTVLAGGAFVATLLAAGGVEVGDSKVAGDDMEVARRIRERAGEKLVLPVDVVVAKSQEPDAQRETVNCDNVRPGWQILDIGPRTIDLFREKLADAETVIWNGPLGLFEMEPYRKGSSASRGACG